MLEWHEGDPDEEAAQPGRRRIAHPGRRHPGPHHLRRLDLAVERPVAREETDARVHAARPQVGHEREHGTLGAAAVECGQEEQHARRRI